MSTGITGNGLMTDKKGDKAMQTQSCHPLREGEILNQVHSEYPLFEVTIHGSKQERIKLSKRLVCAVKHLPLRLNICYEKDTQKSIDKGVQKDPSLLLKDEIIAEGLVSAESLSETFEKLLV